MFLFKKWQRRRNNQCELCANPLQTQSLMDVSGQQDQIQITFDNLPVRYCGIAGHPQRYILPDFGADLTDSLFWGNQSHLSKTGGFTQTQCYQCDAKLNSPDTEYGTVSFELNFQETSALQVTIQGPIAQCGNCGAKQLLATKDVSNKLSDAIANAFEAVNLKY